VKSDSDADLGSTPCSRQATAAQPRSGIVTFSAAQVHELVRIAFDAGVARGELNARPPEQFSVESDGDPSPEDHECIVCHEQIKEGALIRLAHKACADGFLAVHMPPTEPTGPCPCGRRGCQQCYPLHNPR
jgi:hypothetical protein